jgi:hypothetical protein
MTFKRDKYTKLLAYLICACCDKRHIGKTVLSNLLYFIDFNYYELYQKSLTNEKYFKTKKGIEPEHFKKVCNLFNEYTAERTDLNVKYHNLMTEIIKENIQ